MNTLVFSLSDLFHLAEGHELVKELVAGKTGLTVVAGIDPRASSGPARPRAFLPSGRQGVFRILVDEILAAHPRTRCGVITQDEKLVRVTRRQRGRVVEIFPVESHEAYAEQIAAAAQHKLLVIDRLYPENVAAALSAAQDGHRVIAQFDTVFRGAEVARQLLDLGAGQELLSGLAWVLTVQRAPALCPTCRQATAPDADQLNRLHERFPQLAGLATQVDASEQAARFYQAAGCERCKHSGRYGDIALFDLFRTSRKRGDSTSGESQLSMEAYMWRLVTQGRLDLEDLLEFERDQSHRTFNLFAASERELLTANAQLNRRLAELEAAQRVMQQRTSALIALQELGQAMIAASEPGDLANQICRLAHDLSNADRAILYGYRQPGQFEVIGVAGWDQKFLHRVVDQQLLAELVRGKKPSAYNQIPPGVFTLQARAEALLAGLGVPLRAQKELVGVMIVQTTTGSRFEPGTAALLQTLASQAALALQRAGLVEQLRAQIEYLEAAQRGLGEKERLEREMELAHQVQQSVLPRRFPEAPGFRFAARNQPARQVGGDFYDLFALDEGRFAIAIADVSGKGMPAALYMALTRSLLRAEARRLSAPREVVGSLNQLVHELGEAQSFVTLFYGVVDQAARRLTYVRAGHDWPLLLRGGALQMLDAAGTALGLIEPDSFQLSEESLDLLPGDRLVLYTDGLTDVVGPQGRMFDREQFKSVIEACANLEPEDMCAVVFSDLAAYRGQTEQFDDMTMVVVAVDG